MFNSTKYIIIQDGGMEIPIVFPFLLKHSEVAGQRKVIAAGFVSFGTEEVALGTEWAAYPKATCYGTSTSLKIASREAVDAAIIDDLILERQKL